MWCTFYYLVKMIPIMVYFLTKQKLKQSNYKNAITFTITTAYFNFRVYKD